MCNAPAAFIKITKSIVQNSSLYTVHLRQLFKVGSGYPNREGKMSQWFLIFS